MTAIGSWCAGEGARVRLFTRGGLAFPAIVEAASTISARSILIDGEAVICRAELFIRMV